MGCLWDSTGGGGSKESYVAFVSGRGGRGRGVGKEHNNQVLFPIHPKNRRVLVRKCEPTHKDFPSFLGP